MASPAFQFYAADYLADENVAIMTLEEEGAYIRALAYCWREGSIPSDPQILSRLLKGASTTVVSVVAACFNQMPTDDRRLVHPRLEREREKQREWARKSSEGGKLSARLRQESKLKDQPSVKVGSRVVQPNANSSSSSSSSNELNTNAAAASEINSTPKPEKKPATLKAKEPRADIPVWLPVDAWEGFEDMRKKIRAPLTDHAKELLISKLDKWRQEGQDVAAALNQSTERGWRGVWPAEVTQQGNSLQEVGNGTSGISATKRRVNANRQAIAEAVKRRGWANTGGPDSADGRQVPEPGSERLA